MNNKQRKSLFNARRLLLIFKKSPIAYMLRQWQFSVPSFKHIPNNPWPGDYRKARLLIETYPSTSDLSSKNMWTDQTLSQTASFQNFSWFDDLRALGDNQSRRFMRASILSWARTFKHYNQFAWTPSLTAERLSQWINHFEFFGQSADDEFLRHFYKSFYHQFRYLQSSIAFLSPNLDSVIIIKGLLITALAYEFPHEKKFKILFQKLNKSLQALLYKDGFLQSTSPDQQLIILKHLIELRNFLRICHLGKETVRIQQTITKMVPPLRFLRHGDGRLSFLSGNSHYSSPVVDTVLALSDVKGRHPLRSEDAGLERLQVKNNIILLRTRFTDFPEQSSGNLQFEWSHGKDRLIKCCDIMLETQKGHTFQSRSMAHTYKQQEEDHAFIELKLHDINHLHTREIYLGPEIDLRVSEKIRLNRKGYGAIRIVVNKTLSPHIASDGQSVLLTTEKGDRHRIHFSNIDEITLNPTSFLGDEDIAIFALFEANANTPRDIKWSFSG